MEHRIGVFVCHCGANIGSVVNVPSAADYAMTLPDVVYAQEQLFSCATNSAKEITDLAVEKGLNRVVIAACSPSPRASPGSSTKTAAAEPPHRRTMASEMGPPPSSSGTATRVR